MRGPVAARRRCRPWSQHGARNATACHRLADTLLAGGCTRCESRCPSPLSRAASPRRDEAGGRGQHVERRRRCGITSSRDPNKHRCIPLEIVDAAHRQSRPKRVCFQRSRAACPGLMAPARPHAREHHRAASLQMRGFRTDRFALPSRASGEPGNAGSPTFRLSSRRQSKALPCNILINLTDLYSRCSPRRETSRKNRGVFHKRGRLTFAGRLRVISAYRQPLITISPLSCRRALNSHYLVI